MITSFEIISRERQSRCVSVSVFSVVLRSTCITSVNLMPSSCSHWPRDTIDMLLHNSPSWIHDLSRIHLPKTRRHIVHDDFCFGFVVWFVWEVHWSNKEEEVKKKVEAWRGTDMAREEDIHNITIFHSFSQSHIPNDYIPPPPCRCAFFWSSSVY